MGHRAEGQNQVAGSLAEFVLWQRNVQHCDQRTAWLLKESGFELFSTHLLFSLSLL